MSEPRAYRNYSRRPVKRSRTISLPGDGEEYGNWYSCWVCGHPNNDVTEPLDDGATRMHTELTDNPKLSMGARLGAPLSAQTYFDNINTVFVSAQTGADGNPKKAIHRFEIVRTNGCPVCGTSNWKGDF